MRSCRVWREKWRRKGFNRRYLFPDYYSLRQSSKDLFYTFRICYPLFPVASMPLPNLVATFLGILMFPVARAVERRRQGRESGHAAKPNVHATTKERKKIKIPSGLPFEHQSGLVAVRRSRNDRDAISTDEVGKTFRLLWQRSDIGP